MTKSELVAELASHHDQLITKDAEDAVNTILNAMCEALSSGLRVEIRGFGSFFLANHSPKIGRNPKSGELVMIPTKCVPRFRPGKALRERVDAIPEIKPTDPVITTHPL